MKYKNILLIDDDLEDQEFFLLALEHFDTGINCVPMSSAKIALKKLTSHELSPEVIFLDLNMPEMDGFQFLSETRQIPDFNTPIIVLSTCSRSETINSVKKMGADEYLSKPNSIRKLVQILTPFFT